MIQERRIAVLAEHMLDFHHGKTAVSIVRYRPQEVACIIDSANAGKTAHDVLGIGGAIPIVTSMEDALLLTPTELLIGIAPRGGALPHEWRVQIVLALRNGVDVVSGLHSMLQDDEEFVRVAKENGARIIDVRQPPEEQRVATMEARREGVVVTTFVGSDCAVGKMTAALEVTDAARKRGLSACFAPTGQTGIMLEGWGVPLDRVIGDFMAGAAETLVLEASERADYVFVEGQGSLLHPGYSSVTLALMHGSLPDMLILVHQPSLTHVDEYPLAIPSLPDLIALYEAAAGWVKPARVVAIALNTRDLDQEATQQAIERAIVETGLPTTDPIKFGGDTLVDAVMSESAPALTS